MREPAFRLLPGLLLFAAAACAQPNVLESSKMTTLPLQPVCVGRVQVEVPGRGNLSWSQSFDHSEVSRLTSVRTRDDFWERVGTRRRELEALPHDLEPNRMSHYQQVGEDAAIILYREHEASKRAHRMQRYLWLDDKGYEFRTGAMREHLTRDLAVFGRVFHSLKSRGDREMPAAPGFCIDGALIQGDVGRISAGASIRVPGWNNVRVWVGTFEGPAEGDAAHRQAAPVDDELERERDAMDTVRREDSGAAADPVYPREFEVLRQQDRSGGLKGREVVWRKILNNGAVIYTFRWKSEAGGQGPHASLGIDAGDKHDPEAAPPDAEVLLALWDAMLASLRQRPGTY